MMAAKIQRIAASLLKLLRTKMENLNRVLLINLSQKTEADKRVAATASPTVQPRLQRDRGAVQGGVSSSACNKAVRPLQGVRRGAECASSDAEAAYNMSRTVESAAKERRADAAAAWPWNAALCSGVCERRV